MNIFWILGDRIKREKKLINEVECDENAKHGHVPVQIVLLTVSAETRRPKEQKLDAQLDKPAHKVLRRI